eukprot:TRINITY_DN1897_c0_g1_i5.p1 TRINITY_DN1897_c0_g1~~TRINITY_DN1897_c0_g1_i5.p1  ORF type:complete len:310 (-),score=64.17 TRINITY_DN1897_c0_g1_i5:226-1020(-)
MLPSESFTSSPYSVPDQSIVEINVGGEIFTTTLHTLHREPSFLSVAISARDAPNGVVKRDKEGRIFLDRDPTHFRWILNFLRDGYIVAVPSSIQDRLELLQEARFYQLGGLISVIEHQANQTDPIPKEVPSFFTARPSSKGLFYLPDLKWNVLALAGIKETLDTIGIKFEEGKDEVYFYSMTIDRATGTLSSSEVVCQSKLMLDMRTAKATILIPDPMGQQQLVEVLFWWEPSTTQYPQLHARVYRGETIFMSRGLDFFRTINE